MFIRIFLVSLIFQFHAGVHKIQDFLSFLPEKLKFHFNKYIHILSQNIYNVSKFLLVVSYMHAFRQLYYFCMFYCEAPVLARYDR